MIPRGLRPRIAWLGALTLGLAAGAAHAQVPDTIPMPTGIPIIQRDSSFVRTRMFNFTVPRPRPPGAASRRTIPALEAPALARLREAQRLRENGQLEKARDLLADLNRDVPHHALVLTEYARVLLEQAEFAPVEKLARAERAIDRDSLLLGRELAFALERLGHPREAALVALEGWAASPSEAEWAQSTLQRLSPLQGRAIREAARKTAEKLPDRADIGMGVARLEWRLGDGPSAMRMLAGADRAGLRPPLRWMFAEELIRTGSSRDTAGAMDALVSLASEPRTEQGYRMMAVMRAWELAGTETKRRETAPRIQTALRDLPPARWPGQLLVEVVRGLREGGRTTEARALLGTPGAESGGQPELALERALSDLRDDGPTDKTLASLRAISDGSPEATFRYAEALFYSGLGDSAKVVYQRAAADPTARFAGAALERIYLIEEAQSPTALAQFGRVAYLDWRGDAKAALALTDSLYHQLPRGAMWAQAAIQLAARRDAAGDPKAAVEPLTAVADSLPGDRLAPLARQRLGDLYLFKLKDDAQALHHYEECLARYPKAWNAPEVRRRLEALRRDRRF